jgi:hypothetical protein
MPSTEKMLAAKRREIRPLLEAARESMLTKARGVPEEAGEHRTQELAEIAKERAQGLADVAERRAKGLAEVDARRAELRREV